MEDILYSTPYMNSIMYPTIVGSSSGRSITASLLSCSHSATKFHVGLELTYLAAESDSGLEEVGLGANQTSMYFPFFFTASYLEVGVVTVLQQTGTFGITAVK